MKWFYPKLGPYQLEPQIGYDHLILLVHIDDLLQGYPENDVQWFGFIQNWLLKWIVRFQQIVDQETFIQARRYGTR